MTTPSSIRFQASSTTARACAFGLASVITFAVLAGLGGVADLQFNDAMLAQMNSLPTQVLASLQAVAARS